VVGAPPQHAGGAALAAPTLGRPWHVDWPEPARTPPRWTRSDGRSMRSMTGRSCSDPASSSASGTVGCWLPDVPARPRATTDGHARARWRSSDLRFGGAVLFGVIEQGSAPQLIATIPEFLWEPSLGICLIAEGFKSSQIISGNNGHGHIAVDVGSQSPAMATLSPRQPGLPLGDGPCRQTSGGVESSKRRGSYRGRPMESGCDGFEPSRAGVRPAVCGDPPRNHDEPPFPDRLEQKPRSRRRLRVDRLTQCR
jgi:hypothetical protein